MKMTTKHYNFIKLQFQCLKIEDCLENYQTIKAESKKKRLAWDMVRACNLNQFVCDELYKYLNDSHIETALLKIIHELGYDKNLDS